MSDFLHFEPTFDSHDNLIWGSLGPGKILEAPTLAHTIPR